MKLIREHINEKFTEDSDPVADMGIGMMHQIKKFLKESGIAVYKEDDEDELLLSCAVKEKYKFVDYLINIGAKVERRTITEHRKKHSTLRICAYHGKFEMVKYLVKKYNADIDGAIKESEQCGESLTLYNLEKAKEELENES